MHNCQNFIYCIWCFHWKVGSNCCLLKQQDLLLFIYVVMYSSIIMQVCGRDPTVDWQGRRFCQWWHMVSCCAVCYKQWRPTGDHHLSCMIHWIGVFYFRSHPIINFLVLYIFSPMQQQRQESILTSLLSMRQWSRCVSSPYYLFLF